MTGAAPQRPHVAAEPHACKEYAEDGARPGTERLVWAVLAVAAELAALRRDLRRTR
ncbi:hypothetical protein [Streptomyces fradiae]|uniref:hypothetical protein n=1 Tax=Streptomyces fradiae TaxID=1906 RepID=UPI002941DCEC|nr:hypothetical protein [Streptomyces fradiae]WOI58606.1 hypothetical protein RYQ63_00900 [Streptomyces fradiae]